MIFKYCFVHSIGCLKNNLNCFILKITTYFKNGSGFIFYKKFLDKNILKFLKFTIFYLNINFHNYDFYIIMNPLFLKKYDNCIQLSLFISIFLSFFKLNLKNKILIFGGVNLKNGKILKISNIIYKFNFFRNNNFKLLIIPFDNSFFENNILILKFKYLMEVYYFLIRCLTQRKSNVFTHRLSGVRFSQHL